MQGDSPFFLTDLGWVNGSRINQQAIKKRIDDLLSSRTVNANFQAEWLARAIQCIDLTTLAGNCVNIID